MAVALFVTFSARTVIQKYLSLVVKRIRAHGPRWAQTVFTGVFYYSLHSWTKLLSIRGKPDSRQDSLKD